VTEKEKVSTLLVRNPLTMLPKHVLMYPGHCFIINVQPICPCVAVSRLV
jgi:hypothetical protein